MTRSITALFAVAGLSLAASPACSAVQDSHVRPLFSPDPNLISRSAAVDYSDLDLASPSDQQTLAVRIEHAAVEVCKITPRHHDDLMTVRECGLQAISDAVRSLHSRDLSLIARARRGSFLAARADAAPAD